MAGTSPDMTEEKNERPGAIPAFFFFAVDAVYSVVIVREGGRSSTPRLLGSIADAGDY
jgi:hypothetical protein